MERDPKFLMNKDKFYDAKSYGAQKNMKPPSVKSYKSGSSKPLSAVQKFDQFIKKE